MAEPVFAACAVDAVCVGANLAEAVARGFGIEVADAVSTLVGVVVAWFACFADVVADFYTVDGAGVVGDVDAWFAFAVVFVADEVAVFGVAGGGAGGTHAFEADAAFDGGAVAIILARFTFSGGFVADAADAVCGDVAFFAFVDAGIGIVGALSAGGGGFIATDGFLGIGALGVIGAAVTVDAMELVVADASVAAVFGGEAFDATAGDSGCGVGGQAERLGAVFFGALCVANFGFVGIAGHTAVCVFAGGVEVADWGCGRGGALGFDGVVVAFDAGVLDGFGGAAVGTDLGEDAVFFDVQACVVDAGVIFIGIGNALDAGVSVF